MPFCAGKKKLFDSLRVKWITRPPWGRSAASCLCFLRGRLGWVYLKRAAHFVDMRELNSQQIVSVPFDVGGEVFVPPGETGPYRQRNATQHTAPNAWCVRRLAATIEVNPSDWTVLAHTAASAKAAKCRVQCSPRVRASGLPACTFPNIIIDGTPTEPAEIRSSTGSTVHRQAVIRDARPSEEEGIHRSHQHGAAAAAAVHVCVCREPRVEVGRLRSMRKWCHDDAGGAQAG
ncbi:hypothetical protein QBC34DRAFT_182284 [Podospora aff. communis PSN243]|uniref:Uncharacterized protein n=1 Tax=Podospora aff. communis PSN243 TaxID=3040156 RepID=A0AAV9GBL6_9PEZI|nr:hypothetical protein QBC34DRAFT_182284 [Podospora aff. communis PSN243]